MVSEISETNQSVNENGFKNFRNQSANENGFRNFWNQTVNENIWFQKFLNPISKWKWFQKFLKPISELKWFQKFLKLTKHKIHGQFVALKLRINISPCFVLLQYANQLFFSSFTQDTQKFSSLSSISEAVPYFDKTLINFDYQFSIYYATVI